MARGDMGLYHTGVSEEIAVVHKQYDASGNVVADAQGTTGVTSVDCIILGFRNGKRSEVPVGTDTSEFEFI